jgi:hypothetical protein
MKKSIIILLTIVSIFASCKKEDNVPPVINSVNIQLGDTLRNSFEIKVDATDNSGVSAIEVYANDSLIIKDTKSSLDYSLNTLAMKDGEYAIKTIVYDAKGNKTESSYKVQIQNALLTFNLGNVDIPSFPVVICDEQGNILRSLSLQGKGKVKIMPQAACNKNSFNVVYSRTNGGFTGIMAYIHVKRGSEYNQGWGAYAGPVTKSFKLHLKNDIGSFSRINISTDQAVYQVFNMADTINLPNAIPYTSNHKLLLQLLTDNGQYFKVVTIENVQELSVKLSDINQSELVKTYSLPSEGSASFLLMGTGAETDSINRYFISQNFNELLATHLNVIYPTEYFSKFCSYVSFSPTQSQSGSSFAYVNQYRGEIPESFVPISADFSITNTSSNNFKADITGTFDYYDISFYDPSQTIELLVSAPENQKGWTLPDLTAVFGNTAFTNFTWNTIQIMNMGSLDWTGKYYDTSINFEHLNYFETYSQGKFIFKTNSKKNSQVIKPGQDLISDMMQKMGMGMK